MVYGKPHCHTRGGVSGVAYLLKVGSNRDGKIEKNVVKNVEKGHQGLGFYSGVSQEYEYQAGIFQREDLSFTESDDGLSDDGTQEIVDEIVDHEEGSDFVNGELEFFDKKEDGKGHEYLPSGTCHKCEEVKEPVFFPENHLFVLRHDIMVCRVLKKTPEACGNNYDSDHEIDLREIKD